MHSEQGFVEQEGTRNGKEIQSKTQLVKQWVWGCATQAVFAVKF